MRAERNVDSHAIALGDKPALHLRTHTVQHLKFEAVRRDLVLLRKCCQGFNEPGIVGRDRGILSRLQQALGHAQIFAANARHVFDRNLRRLIVGTFAQTNPCLQGDCAFKVCGTPFKLGLQDRTDIRMTCKDPLKELQRLLRCR